MAERQQQKMAYTVVEAAALLSVSRAHLYRLIEAQEIGSVSIGRSRRITVHQLECYVERLEEAQIAPLSTSKRRA